MSRKFVTQREIDFINNITKELVQSVSGQEVIYYGISLEHTDADDLYNEAVKKTWYPPVRINARVHYDNTTTKSSEGTLDSDYRLEVYFHFKELEERNVSPREGDFIEFGTIYYEITSVTRPQIVFGQINNKVMIKCVCIPSRENTFQAGGDSEKNKSNAHPISNTNRDVT